MSLIRSIKNIIDFLQLPRQHRRLIFYSESKNYWVHFEGIIHELLNSLNTRVCYITSDMKDPGLKIYHPNYQSFSIDEGAVRNWFFENIDTDVFVMTMPDLNRFQVKRSRFPVYYVYIQHSLVSLHMIYRKGAFDFYDSILCAGPHHVNEIRAMEAKFKLRPKELVEHGYGRLDSIRREAKERGIRESQHKTEFHVLVAPSWGVHGMIETMGEYIVDELLKAGLMVTLRPHPQTLKYSKKLVKKIIEKNANNESFAFESHVAGQETLHESDFMISDWSGAAIEYALGLQKPVLFLDFPRKINNPEYEHLGIEPLEVSIRDQIGKVVKPNLLGLGVINMIENLTEFKQSSHNIIYNQDRSSIIGANYIVKKLALMAANPAKHSVL